MYLSNLNTKLKDFKQTASRSSQPSGPQQYKENQSPSNLAHGTLNSMHSGGSGALHNKPNQSPQSNKDQSTGLLRDSQPNCQEGISEKDSGSNKIPKGGRLEEIS